MKECTDQELIEKLKSGENPALNELMARYKHRLFAFIRRYVGNEDVAYDLVQETFTKLYFSASTYKPEYKFSTWLFQIALNLCRDHGICRGKSWAYLRKHMIVFIVCGNAGSFLKKMCIMP
jgi:RNA polymerase sigma factor (sigma-70 family)